MINQVTPEYYTMARQITGLPKSTSIIPLLYEAELPPLDPYFDMISQRYSIRILLSKDNHLCKKTIVRLMSSQGQFPRNGAGLHRIASVAINLSSHGDLVENTTDGVNPKLESPHISLSCNEEGSADHERWVQHLPPETMLLYTDVSKKADSRTSTIWHSVVTIGKNHPPAIIFKGNCQIGKKADIEDGKIHSIQGGLSHLNKLQHIILGTICLGRHNQHGLRAQSAGPSAAQEYIEECQKEVKTLHLKGCRVQGKWTMFHLDIGGNEKADKLTKADLNKTECI